jgi:hypothetical protein
LDWLSQPRILQYFFLPAIAAYLLWKRFADRAAHDSPVEGSSPSKDIKAAVAIAIVALVTLLPFANPVSYVHEVLTPVAGRDFDPRGEDVESFSLGAQITGEATSSSVTSSNVQVSKVVLLQQFVKSIVPWNTHLGFVVLAILACGPRIKDDVFAISFIFLLMMLPYRIIFGSGLGYRSLIFVPFLCIVASRMTTLRWGLSAAAFLAVVSFVMLLDPFAAQGLSRVVLE